jgi:hypothetical protein
LKKTEELKTNRNHEKFLLCYHLADTKALNTSKNHYRKKSTDFGFAVKQRKLKSNPNTLHDEQRKTERVRSKNKKESW